MKALILYVVSSTLVIWVNKNLITKDVSVIDVMWYQNLFGIILLTILGGRMPRPFKPALVASTTKVGDIGMNLLVLGSMSVAMSTALRRLSILFTFFMERFYSEYTHSGRVQAGIYTITLGTIVAVLYDNASSWESYGYLLLSNTISAVNNVFSDKFIKTHSSEALSLQYLTNWCAFTCCSAVMLFRGLTLAPSPAILISSMLGLGVNLSLLWAFGEGHNPLTVSVIGATRSILLSWASIAQWLGQDYIFTWPNFIGLNVASIGCIIYVIAKAARSNA